MAMALEQNNIRGGVTMYRKGERPREELKIKTSSACPAASDAALADTAAVAGTAARSGVA